MLDSIADIEKKIDNAFKSNAEIATTYLDEIISRMPAEIQALIDSAFKFQRIPKEYLLSSIFFAFSNASGLAFSINALGYTNYANLYFAIVGSRGDLKSPAMELATKTLTDYDNDKYKEFKHESRNVSLGSEKVLRKQLLLQDATIESAILSHYQNRYSVGIYIDELYFMIQKMANKNSNEGAAWRTFFLQGNTNKHIDISRKTTESFRINKSYPTLLGSIQNQFVNKLFADGNLESGLIDRMLFTTKLTTNNQFSTTGIPESILDNYSILLTNLLNARIEVDYTHQLDEIQIDLAEDAKRKLINYSQHLIDRQNLTTDLCKEYIAKMLINIHKISLLVHLILNSSKNNYQKKITAQTIETAILILEFYFTNFKIVLEENIVDKKPLPSPEEVIRLAIKNNATQKDVVAITGMDKSSISRKWNRVLTQLATDKQL